MATWSEVELLTNEDTNTVRFDSVSRDENGSGLYQVDTLVKISTANEVIHVHIYTSHILKMLSCILVAHQTLLSWGIDKTYLPWQEKRPCLLKLLL